MAKRNNDHDSGSEKAEVRVFFVEVKGSNDSVREALKSMVAAMERPVKMVGVQRTPANGSAPALAPQSETETIEELVEEGDDSSDGSNEPAATRRPRGTGPKKDHNAGIALVPNLNFMPEGKPTLKQFFAEKNPDNDMAKVLVLVYYMQHIMELPKIGPGHIRTAFRDVGEATPASLKQTIRNMRHKRIWVNYEDLEEIRTTTQGDNYVEFDLANKK